MEPYFSHVLRFKTFKFIFRLNLANVETFYLKADAFHDFVALYHQCWTQIEV